MDYEQRSELYKFIIIILAILCVLFTAMKIQYDKEDNSPIYKCKDSVCYKVRWMKPKNPVYVIEIKEAEDPTLVGSVWETDGETAKCVLPALSMSKTG